MMYNMHSFSLKMVFVIYLCVFICFFCLQMHWLGAAPEERLWRWLHNGIEIKSNVWSQSRTKPKGSAGQNGIHYSVKNSC